MLWCAVYTRHRAFARSNSPFAYVLAGFFFERERKQYGSVRAERLREVASVCVVIAPNSIGFLVSHVVRYLPSAIAAVAAAYAAPPAG